MYLLIHYSYSCSVKCWYIYSYSAEYSQSLFGTALVCTLCVTAQRSVFHDVANVWHDCVFSELQIGQISGGVIGTLVFVGAIVIVFIIVKRYRKSKRVGVSEVICRYSCTECPMRAPGL